MHTLIRNYLERLSRKSDNNIQIADVHHRLLERSDPYLIHKTSLLLQSKVCTICKATDHTIRSHDRYAEHGVEGIGRFFFADRDHSLVMDDLMME